VLLICLTSWYSFKEALIYFDMDLFMPIENLRSVGARNISRLNKLGIKTLKDLLWHLPSRYENYADTMAIRDVEVGQKVNIQGEIIRINSRRLFPRRLTITDAVVQDSSGSIKVVWFNQPYIANSLKEGTIVSLAGKVTLNKGGVCLSSPVYEKITGTDVDDQSLKHTSGLVPVYPETDGVTSKYLRFLIKPILESLDLPDSLPAELVEKYGFYTLPEALNYVHYPEYPKQADQAKERLAFDDLLLFQLKSLIERRKLNELKSVSIKFNQQYIKDFISKLPFELTKDQKVAAWEILKDLEKPYPMNRLVQGDVGSGKTVVSLIAAVQVAQKKHQTVIMAPTEVLANQHYETIAKLTQGSDLKFALLTSSAAMLNGERVSKAELKKVLAQDDSVDILVGTHAVIQQDVKFKNLALVVVDEQHRFGIEQRSALLKSNKSKGQDIVPHFLSMTATPIPRTLSLTIFGDLDISIIREKPKNRQKIITQVISSDKRDTAYDFIRQEVNQGRQIFVICPRIESSDPAKEEAKTETEIVDKKVKKPRQLKMDPLWADIKAVQDEFKKLSEEIFPDLKVAMLHGKLKAKDKNEIMQSFKDGWYHILVSTSVIEVGVDIPNATIMMIEGADRFGLAQLHQFRGRVGRGAHQSYCLLFSSDGNDNNRRLKVMVECDDGFVLAEKDMMLRGPGEFFGIKQSGLPDLTMASLANVDLIKKARLEARTILKDNPDLSRYPLLLQRLSEFQKLSHFE
jgi:ATP-dependent DNA helicase RecG